MAQYEATIFVEYHTVLIFELESDRSFSGPDIVGTVFVKHNGSALALHTRKHTGHVNIAVDIETTAPAINHDEWDDMGGDTRYILGGEITVGALTE